MTRNKLVIVVLVIPALMGGCGMPTVSEARHEAYAEWSQHRAKVFHTIATDHYNYGQLDKAIAKVTEAHKLDKSNREINVLLVKLYIETGQYAKAQKELEYLRDQAPRSAEVCYLLGVVSERQQKYNAALQYYSLAYEMDSSTPASVVAAAEVMVTMGKVREARAYLRKHMNHADHDQATYELAGRIAMMCKDHPEAIRYFQQLVVMEHRNKHYPEMLARAYFLAEEYTRSVAVLNELLANEDYKPAPWVEVMLGDCHFALGSIARARQLYAHAASRRQGDPGVWVSLAKADLAAGQPQQAINSARKAWSLDPKSPDAALVLGYALIRQKQPSQAIEMLQETLKAHPRDGMLHCLLGRAYASAGKSKKATDCYNHALKLEPKNQLARTLLAQAETAK